MSLSWQVGDIVQVVGNFTAVGQCLVDNTHNLVILNPDIQISATDISDTVDCMRRAVLKHRVKVTDSANPSQVYGNILHILLQDAMKEDRWDSEWFRNLIRSTLPRFYESLLEANMAVEEATDFLLGKIPKLQEWASMYLNRLSNVSNNS